MTRCCGRCFHNVPMGLIAGGGEGVCRHNLFELYTSLSPLPSKLLFGRAFTAKTIYHDCVEAGKAWELDHKGRRSAGVLFCKSYKLFESKPL
jgi:hypothetical protein